ncbi:hypothetical protein RIF29_39009 [Crotalaria pallida]|uniref:Uncharacterized protein n=1 Tax=Crotalaria pallida TaxID=3830 RepID=A0AAN9E193_CROPI
MIHQEINSHSELHNFLNTAPIFIGLSSIGSHYMAPYLFKFGMLKFVFLIEQDDPKVHAVVDKLLDVLKTPSEAVQRGSLLLSISFDAIKTIDKFTLYNSCACFGVIHLVETLKLLKQLRKTRTCVHTPGYPPMIPADLTDLSLLSALDGARIVYFDGSDSGTLKGDSNGLDWKEHDDVKLVEEDNEAISAIYSKIVLENTSFNDAFT